MDNIVNFNQARSNKLAKEIFKEAEKALKDAKKESYFLNDLAIRYIVPLYCELSDLHISEINEGLADQDSKVYRDITDLMIAVGMVRGRKLRESKKLD